MARRSPGARPYRYDTPPSGQSVVPFALVHDPMAQLLVLDIDGDEQLSGIELQDFDDAEHGTGSALLAYRHDQRVDWYVTPGLRLDRAAAEVGAGVGAWVEQDFAHTLDIDDSGVRASVTATLADGRMVQLRLAEGTRSRSRGIDLLAPLGVGIAEPRFLPVFFMPRLDLVQRRGSTIDLIIGDQPRDVVALPVPIPYKLRRCYLTRHCADPVIVRLNPAARESSVPLVAPGAQVRTEGGTLKFTRPAGHPQLTSLQRDVGSHTAWLRLEPGLPDLLAMATGSTADLRWSCGVDHEHLVSGVMHVSRSADAADLVMLPTGRWTPSGGLSRRATIAMFPSFFRTWPTTYRWTSRIELDPPATQTSSWTRTGSGAL